MGRLTKEEILSIVGKRKIDFAIETGTCRGVQLKVIAECFEYVYGIELNERLAYVTQENVPHATVFCGDSRLHLKTKFEHFQDEPICFFLDAHYCKIEPPIEKSEFPLWDELEILSQRTSKDIIIVDDVHTFGRERNDLRHAENAKEWESVTPEEIMKHFPGAKSKIIKDSFVIWR